MRVVIPGGSGQVGTLLARRLHADGNLSAPHPLPNAEFTRELRRAWPATCVSAGGSGAAAAELPSGSAFPTLGT